MPELCLFAYCRGGHTTAVAEYPDNAEPNTQISKAPAPFCGGQPIEKRIRIALLSAPANTTLLLCASAVMTMPAGWLLG